MTGHFDSSSLVAQIAQAAERWARADVACDELIDQSIALAQKRREVIASRTRASDRAHSVNMEPCDIERLGRIDLEIEKIDERIALACKTVTDREAEWKLLARRMIEL